MSPYGAPTIGPDDLISLTRRERVVIERDISSAVDKFILAARDDTLRRIVKRNTPPTIREVIEAYITGHPPKTVLASSREVFKAHGPPGSVWKTSPGTFYLEASGRKDRINYWKLLSKVAGQNACRNGKVPI